VALGLVNVDHKTYCTLHVRMTVP